MGLLCILSRSYYYIDFSAVLAAAIIQANACMKCSKVHLFDFADSLNLILSEIKFNEMELNMAKQNSMEILCLSGF